VHAGDRREPEKVFVGPRRALDLEHDDDGDDGDGQHQQQQQPHHAGDGSNSTSDSGGVSDFEQQQQQEQRRPASGAAARLELLRAGVVMAERWEDGRLEYLVAHAHSEGAAWCDARELRPHRALLDAWVCLFVFFVCVVCLWQCQLV
jgi:hypothetical protein